MGQADLISCQWQLGFFLRCSRQNPLKILNLKYLPDDICLNILQGVTPQSLKFWFTDTHMCGIPWKQNRYHTGFRDFLGSAALKGDDGGNWNLIGSILNSSDFEISQIQFEFSKSYRQGQCYGTPRKRHAVIKTN